MPITEDAVRETLKQVIDPELFINIIDLGLVYGVTIEPAGDKENIKIEMTMTSPGLPRRAAIDRPVEASARPDRGRRRRRSQAGDDSAVDAGSNDGRCAGPAWYFLGADQPRVHR